MFSKSEIKNSLLGCLEVALFMPQAVKRFGTSYEAMIKSFYIPVVLFPVSLLIVFLYPRPELVDHSDHIISMMYSLRFAVALGIFLGFVYFLASKIQRTDHFYQFVIANNWLTIPTSVISIPLIIIMTSKGYTSGHIEALSVIILFYTYAYTAFMAACVLRIPLELAVFVMMIGFYINDTSHDIVGWVGSIL